MKLPFWPRKKPPQTRRQLAAQRQAQAHTVETAAPGGAYRRNRNLNTRQTDSPAATSERLATHIIARRRRARHHRLAIVAGCLVGIGIVVMQLSIYISVQTPDATSAHQSSRYQQVLQQYYASRPLERLRFLTDYKALQEFFLKHASEVKSIRLEGSRPLTTSLKLVFRQPVVQWSSTNKVYFVDDNGVTFERNYFATPTVIVKDQSGVPASAGQEVINHQFLSFLGQAVAAFTQHRLQVAEVILPPNTVRQVHFVTKGRPYAIKMTIDRAAEAQVAQAAKTIQFLDQRKLTPEYIDVRVDQRVFYR